MNRIIVLIVVATIPLAGLGGCRSCQNIARHAPRAGALMVNDHINFYAPRSTARLGVGFGIGAAMAHTDVDQELADWWQNHARSTSTDDVSQGLEHLGDGRYVVPAVVAAAVIGELWPENRATSVVGDWGYQTGRSLAVGAPPILLLQAATGASRPGESSAESDWVLFADNNGVSGHAFIGAVPFITAAKMTDDRGWKAVFYVSSTAVALSRINDNAHYTSQAMLGWWIAYLAADAVSTTEQNQSCCELLPVPVDDGVGIGVVIRR